MKKFILFITLILTASYDVYSAYPNPGAGFTGPYNPNQFGPEFTGPYNPDAGFFRLPLNLNPSRPIPMMDPTIATLSRIKDLLINVNNNTVQTSPETQEEIETDLKEIASLATGIAQRLERERKIANNRKNKIAAIKRKAHSNPDLIRPCSTHGFELVDGCAECSNVEFKYIMEFGQLR